MKLVRDFEARRGSQMTQHARHTPAGRVFENDVATARERLDDLYQEAFDSLSRRVKPMRARAMLDQLSKLTEQNDPVAVSKTEILICIAGRLQPHRTMKRLKALQAMMGRAGFEAFEQSIFEACGGRPLSWHGYHTHAFEAMDHEVVWQGVSELVSALEAEGYQVFLNSGTLLGVVRDGKLIGHDDDVDLGIILPGATDEEVGSAWRALGARLRELNLREEHDGPTCLYKLKSSTGCDVDLFPCWINQEGRVFVYPHTTGELTRRDLVPMRQAAITGLPMPARPEAMLELNYGPNWRKPDPYFQFPWADQGPKYAAWLAAAERHTPRQTGEGVVLTYGTFDLFHVGHARLLERLSRMGRRLVVGCSTDEFNALKGKEAIMSYEERSEILRACRYVDHVFPERHWDQKRQDVIEYEADLFAMGDDWSGKFDELRDLCDVVYLPRTRDISTTEVKSWIRESESEHRRA